MSKYEEAEKIINQCIGKKGVWASTERYKNQCWTRDFCLAVCPYLLNGNKYSIVETHLLNIASKQAISGKIPILYLDDEREFLKEKVEKSIEKGEMSFMLKRYLDGELENLTPTTRDSEVLFIIAVREFFDELEKNGLYSQTTSILKLQRASQNAMVYIKKYLLDDGKKILFQGADWRDTREDLDDKCVLTNACLLYKAYLSMDDEKSAAIVKKYLNDEYWNGLYFIDYPNPTTPAEADVNVDVNYENKTTPAGLSASAGPAGFDLLGNSLACIYGVANHEQRKIIFSYPMTKLSTPFGFKMMDTFLPPISETERKIMEKDNAFIWPFTNGFMILALLSDPYFYKIGVDEMKKWSKLDGFYEWYDISEGGGYGSKNQLWSAALFLRAYVVLESVDFY